MKAIYWLTSAKEVVSSGCKKKRQRHSKFLLSLRRTLPQDCVTSTAGGVKFAQG